LVVDWAYEVNVIATRKVRSRIFFMVLNLGLSKLKQVFCQIGSIIWKVN
jgi:hypothetical protein